MLEIDKMRILIAIILELSDRELGYVSAEVFVTVIGDQVSMTEVTGFLVTTEYDSVVIEVLKIIKNTRYIKFLEILHKLNRVLLSVGSSVPVTVEQISTGCKDLALKSREPFRTPTRDRNHGQIVSSIFACLSEVTCVNHSDLPFS